LVEDVAHHAAAVDVVVKIGGGVLADGERLAAVLTALDLVSRDERLLVVPGGGPFADAVREVDGRITLADDTAHWMAILAMDQYAHLLASRLDRGVLVDRAQDIGSVCSAGGVPVLAPSRWLRDVDPLPHSWTVTSDSIAAWVTGQVGARRLILIKPSGASVEADLVDAHFLHALPVEVLHIVVPADRLELLRTTPSRPPVRA